MNDIVISVNIIIKLWKLILDCNGRQIYLYSKIIFYFVLLIWDSSPTIFNWIFPTENLSSEENFEIHPENFDIF